MKAYELLFFVAPTLEEEARANVMGRIENVITVLDQIDNAEFQDVDGHHRNHDAEPGGGTAELQL